MITPRIGGVALTSIDPSWGELKVTHRWPFGSWEATWRMMLNPLERPPALVADAYVDIPLAGHPVWAGNLVDSDWADGEFAASGLARQAEAALCFDGAGKTTSKPRTAANNAIGHDWLDWTDVSALPDTAFAGVDETSKLNAVAALLDAVAEEQAKKWTVDAYGRAFLAADPMTPAFHILPGAGEMGVSTEKQVGELVGRWQDSAGKLHTTSVGTGRPAIAVDLTKRGALDTTRATAILNGIRTKAAPDIGFTNGLALTAEQIITPGGIRPHLGHVAERVGTGLMVRQLGARDPRNGASYIDFVVAESSWEVDDNVITLNPVGMAARDLGSIIEEAGGELL